VASARRTQIGQIPQISAENHYDPESLGRPAATRAAGETFKKEGNSNATATKDAAGMRAASAAEAFTISVVFSAYLRYLPDLGSVVLEQRGARALYRSDRDPSLRSG
jgi:hypothetical protein